MKELFYTAAHESYDYAVTRELARVTGKDGRTYRLVEIDHDERRSPGHARTQVDRYASGFHAAFRPDSDVAAHQGLPTLRALARERAARAIALVLALDLQGKGLDPQAREQLVDAFDLLATDESAEEEQWTTGTR